MAASLSIGGMVRPQFGGKKEKYCSKLNRETSVVYNLCIKDVQRDEEIHSPVLRALCRDLFSAECLYNACILYSHT